MIPPQIRRLAAAAAGFAFLAAFFVWRILLAGDPAAVGPDDLLFYHYPNQLATAQWLAKGTLPLWNPYQLCGVPWLATLQIGMLYPPHVLYLLLPVRLAMPLLALGHLALLAFGTVAFARRVGLAWPGALLAAGLCTLAGQSPALVAFPNMLEAGAWLAPGCLAVAVLAEGRGRAGAVGLGFVAAMSLLAGHPQTSAYCIYAWAALLPGLLLTRRAAPALWVKAGALFGAAIALGAAIAAVQLLPALELTRQGTRTLEPLGLRNQLPYGFFQDPWKMLQLTLHGRHPGRVLPLWLGALGLAVLPAAFLVRRRRPVACVTLALGLLALAFALGPATPLFDVYQNLPLLRAFRIPARILFVAQLFLAVAAGAGLDAVVCALQRRAARDGSGAREGRAPLWGSTGFAVALAVVLASSGFQRSALVAALRGGAAWRRPRGPGGGRWRPRSARSLSPWRSSRFCRFPSGAPAFSTRTREQRGSSTRSSTSTHRRRGTPTVSGS